MGANRCVSWRGVMLAVQEILGVMCVSWGEPCPPSRYSRVQVHVLGGDMPSVRVL